MKIDAQQADQFETLLHRGVEGQVAYVLKAVGSGRTRTYYGSPGHSPLSAIPGRLRGNWHVFVSVCTFGGARRAEAAVAAPALWADLDPLSKATGNQLHTWQDEACARLTAFDPPPSLIVCSGRGFHAYWLLDEHLRLDGVERGALAARLVAANRVLAERLGGDTVADLARLMRLPGTKNPKPNAGACRVISSGGPHYRFEDLCRALDVADVSENPMSSSRRVRDDASVGSKGRGRPRLGCTERDLRELPPWARRLVKGGAWEAAKRGRCIKVNGEPDRSRADLAAVGAMVRAGWPDEKVLSAFCHPKWLIGARFAELWHSESPQRGRDYLFRTIDRARSSQMGPGHGNAEFRRPSST